jgi:YVTN family beta-propeller protein
MKKVYYPAFIALICYLLTGCDRDEITGPGSNFNFGSDVGVYVLAEGSSASTSELAFYSSTRDSFFADIYSGDLLFPNGLIYSSQNLYLTQQGNFGSEGKVHILNRDGVEQSSVPAGINPYSLAEANGKLYITNGPSSRVTVVNKGNLSAVTSIPVGSYPQEVTAIGNKVFVCNMSTFGGAPDSTVSVIDASTDAVVATITVKKDPSSLAVTNDNKLLIGCPTVPYIYIVDPATNMKTDSFALTNGFTKDISVDRNSNDIYFIGGAFGNYNISKLNLVSRVQSIVIPASSLIYYGMNYDSQASRIYVAALQDFSSSGRLQIYSNAGSLIKTITTTGVAPRRIVLKGN